MRSLLILFLLFSISLSHASCKFNDLIFKVTDGIIGKPPFLSDITTPLMKWRGTPNGLFTLLEVNILPFLGKKSPIAETKVLEGPITYGRDSSVETPDNYLPEGYEHPLGTVYVEVSPTGLYIHIIHKRPSTESLLRYYNSQFNSEWSYFDYKEKYIRYLTDREFNYLWQNFPGITIYSQGRKSPSWFNPYPGYEARYEAQRMLARRQTIIYYGTTTRSERRIEDDQQLKKKITDLLSFILNLKRTTD